MKKSDKEKLACILCLFHGEFKKDKLAKNLIPFAKKLEKKLLKEISK